MGSQELGPVTLASSFQIILLTSVAGGNPLSHREITYNGNSSETGK